MKLTKSAQNTVLRLQIELTKSVTYTYGNVKLTWFEEISKSIIRKSPVPQNEEQGFLSFNYSSVPRKFFATRAARIPPAIGARMKIQTC